MARPRDPARQVPRPFPRFAGRRRPAGRASIAFKRAWWACRQLCGWVLLPPLLDARSRGLFGHGWPKIEISYCYAIARRSLAKNVAPFGCAAAALRQRARPCRTLSAPPAACGPPPPVAGGKIMRRTAPPALWGAEVWGLGGFPPLMPPPEGLRAVKGKGKAAPSGKKPGKRRHHRTFVLFLDYFRPFSTISLCRLMLSACTLAHICSAIRFR